MDTNTPTQNPITTSPDDVLKILLTLDENKNGGPDRIPNIFWKRTSKHIALPLCIIFNKSLTTGIFPQTLKEAFITPIFKKGDSSLITNYRPVCMLNTISLVFEKIVLGILHQYTDGKIVQQQHGFTKNKSTGSNLVEFTEYVSIALDEGFEVHVIITDFSKAFDCVNHRKLLKKLSTLGMPLVLLKWFESYLSNRSLSVVFNGQRSEPFEQKSGVPQGSVLGPILFNIFINDIALLLKCLFLLFADDMKIYIKIKSLEDSVQLQSDIDSLCKWCDENDLILNISKCHFFAFSNRIIQLQPTYTMRGITLSKMSTIKDLGITFNSIVR